MSSIGCWRRTSSAGARAAPATARHGPRLTPAACVCVGSALILVLANKQDLPNAMSVACVRRLLSLCRSLSWTHCAGTGVCSGRECTDKLGLHALRERKWFIQATCATSGEGLFGTTTAAFGTRPALIVALTSCLLDDGRGIGLAVGEYRLQVKGDERPVRTRAGR